MEGTWPVAVMIGSDDGVILVDPLKELYDRIVQEVGELVVLRFIARFTC
jgi:hypothetical protein